MARTFRAVMPPFEIVIGINLVETLVFGHAGLHVLPVYAKEAIMISRNVKVLVPPPVTPPRGAQWAADAVLAIMWLIRWRSPRVAHDAPQPGAAGPTQAPTLRQIA